MQISNHAPRPQHTPRRRQWVRRATSVAVVAALAGACASDSDEVPATTLDGSVGTTSSPEAEGPQVGLEPGSNLPPTENSSDSVTGDTGMSPGTSAAQATGG